VQELLPLKEVYFFRKNASQTCTAKYNKKVNMHAENGDRQEFEELHTDL